MLISTCNQRFVVISVSKKSNFSRIIILVTSFLFFKNVKHVFLFLMLGALRFYTVIQNTVHYFEKTGLSLLVNFGFDQNTQKTKVKSYQTNALACSFRFTVPIPIHNTVLGSNHVIYDVPIIIWICKIISRRYIGERNFPRQQRLRTLAFNKITIKASKSKQSTFVEIESCVIIL